MWRLARWEQVSGTDVVRARFAISPMLVEQLSVKSLQLLGRFTALDMGNVVHSLGKL